MNNEPTLSRSWPVFVAVVLAVTTSAITPRLARGQNDDDKGGEKKSAIQDSDKKPETKEAGEKAKEHSAPGEGKDAEAVKLTSAIVDKYGIRVGTAKKRKLEASLVVPARVQFNGEAMAVVGSAVEGRISDLKVRLGDQVKKGDELLVLESPALGEAQSDYLQKQAALAAAEVTVEPSKSAYERAKTLYDKSQGISLTELQKRELETKSAQANLLAAQAGRDAAQNRLTLLGMSDAAVRQLTDSKKIDPHYVVRAPIAGRVVERLANLGELVKPEREKLFVVADPATLWVMADVPEARIREVSVGARTKITVASASDREYAGTVANIAPSVDAATRSIRVRVEVKGDDTLKPGMFAQADISAHVEGDGEAVLAVPESAIQTIDGSTAVFVPVKGEENTYAKRMISVGTYAGGMASVISGVEEGEQIVTSGTFILKADLGKAGAAEEE